MSGFWLNVELGGCKKVNVDEEEFKRDYQSGMTMADLCKKYKISQTKYYYLCGKFGLKLKGRGPRLAFDVVNVRSFGGLYLPAKFVKELGLKAGDKVRVKVESKNPMRVLLEKLGGDEG